MTFVRVSFCDKVTSRKSITLLKRVSDTGVFIKFGEIFKNIFSNRTLLSASKDFVVSLHPWLSCENEPCNISKEESSTGRGS